MSPRNDSDNNLGRCGERTPPASTALSDYLVLDLTRVRSGPTCVRQLADWGADVIKIEAPSDKSQMGGPRAGPDFQNLHRNKRSLTLNLKSTEGKKIFMELAQKADVSLRISGPMSNIGSALIMTVWQSTIQGLSMHLFPVLDRMGRWPTDPVLTRSRKAWGG
tara:strand:+ start:427 stop:915 length:489 start_codon:yes stop_codon:yes gene_type:complete